MLMDEMQYKFIGIVQPYIIIIDVNLSLAECFYKRVINMYRASIAKDYQNYHIHRLYFFAMDIGSVRPLMCDLLVPS